MIVRSLNLDCILLGQCVLLCIFPRGRSVPETVLLDESSALIVPVKLPLSRLTSAVLLALQFYSAMSPNIGLAKVHLDISVTSCGKPKQVFGHPTDRKLPEVRIAHPCVLWTQHFAGII